MRTWLATSALTCCVIQSCTLFCASCACAGVATLPVPIAHTRSYAITTRFQSDTSFMLPTVKLLHYYTRLSGNTRVSRYQKGKTNLLLTAGRAAIDRHNPAAGPVHSSKPAAQWRAYACVCVLAADWWLGGSCICMCVCSGSWLVARWLMSNLAKSVISLDR